MAVRHPHQKPEKFYEYPEKYKIAEQSSVMITPMTGQTIGFQTHHPLVV